MTKPTTLVVPFVGAVATATLDATPETELLRSIVVAVLRATFTPERAAAVGATGVAIVRVTLAGADVPPGPVAVNVKLSAP